MNGGPLLATAALALAACASPRHWHDDVGGSLRMARAARQELVVYFALPGRDASDRMQQGLRDAVVLDALAAGDFASAIADGLQRQDLWAAWMGGNEGMGIAVLDGEGRCYASRPGPQDPPELAAFLGLCLRSRPGVQRMRQRRDPLVAPMDQHWLGCLLLELGCRQESEALLRAAAEAGVADARHRLARLFALDGDVVAARRWLEAAPRTGPALVTEGYVLFKERRHREAVAAFEAALGDEPLGDDRQRALLYLGKALHEDKQDVRAVPLLEALAAEGTGSTFEAAARHTLGHLRDPQHGHTH